jgi:spermidine synthase
MRPRFPFVAALFLVSGATGLLYEVAFSKLLAYVFGATAYAVSTVLASFMGGLALGAHFGGRRAARVARPLAAYGALEIAVGVLCALSPASFSLLTGTYVEAARALPGSLAALTLLRAGLTALLVVVPTVAMGATLPLLSRVFAEDAHARAGARLATLYAINTLGGALGALGGAYAVLPSLGVRGTMHAAAAANLIIGAAAIALDRRAKAAPARPAVAAAATPARAPAPAPDDDAGALVLLVLAFVSGVLVFATEVTDTHLLALLIGNSAYAFGLMLAVFLVCLALGAARAPALARRHGDGALARSLAVTALAIAVTLPLWEQLPHVFTFAGKHVASWTGREAVRALAALVVLAPPTVAMGATFPLLLQRAAGRADVAARVGRFTVANTLGTIVGSIGTGYGVLPRLGSERTLVAVVIAFTLAAALAARAPGAGVRAIRRPLAIGVAAVVIALLLPRWDLARLTNGANVYFAAGPPPDAVELVREDVHGGVTTVARRGELRTLYTNGKFQGDDGPEMTAQRRFAHFPSLFVKRERAACVIGLGTGTTLGTIAGYAYERIDVAEISPAIVEASRLFFSGPSLGALDDPRVHLSLNDGRNELLVGTERYDLITMELSSIWFAGAASLYSREFYEIARGRLAEGGVLQQWVQLHHLRRRELATIVRTLRAVFPHVALFVGGGQGILVASEAPLVASAARLARLEATPSVARTLAGHSLASMLGDLVTSGPELDRLVAETEADGGALVSTDDNLYLEYATPKGNVLGYDASLRETVALLRTYTPDDARARHLAP